MKIALTNRARALRRKQTDAELALWNAIRVRRLDGYKFKRQVPRGPYVVDFYCASVRLAIELDGSQHTDRCAAHDLARSNHLEGEGLRVIRFWNNDVLQNLQGVLLTIRQELSETPAPSPGAARHPLPEGRGNKIATSEEPSK